MDHVLPDVPVRQWVLTLPHRLRYLLAWRHDLCRAVVFLDESEEAAALEPVELPEAIRDLWALSFRLPTEEDVGRSFAGVTDLATAVPVFRLRRPLDLDRLDDHVSLVLADV